jgi:copper(I)-binding protein
VEKLFNANKAVAMATLFMSSLLIASPAAAHDFSVGDIAVGHPWSRLAPANAPVIGGYLTLTNTGSQPDTLVGGSATIAERVEIHEMRIEDGVARMRPLPAGQEIAPGATVELQPGGTHLMFINPERAFSEGERFEVTLEFANAGEVAVEFVVQRNPGGNAGQEDEHGGHAP